MCHLTLRASSGGSPLRPSRAVSVSRIATGDRPPPPYLAPFLLTPAARSGRSRPVGGGAGWEAEEERVGRNAARRGCSPHGRIGRIATRHRHPPPPPFSVVRQCPPMTALPPQPVRRSCQKPESTHATRLPFPRGFGAGRDGDLAHTDITQISSASFLSICRRGSV